MVGAVAATLGLDDGAIFKEIVETQTIKTFGFVEMMVFVAIIVVGYVYAWAKGALEWE